MGSAADTPLVDPRTRALLEAPIAPTLLRLAAPMGWRCWRRQVSG